MSYLELAVSLRNYVVIYSVTQVPNLPASFWDNLWQAADAIEQLQKSICPHYIRNVHDRGVDSLCDKYKCEVNALPKWIPVTERLPVDKLLGVRVLCVLKEKKSGWCWVDDRLFMDGKFLHPKGQKGKVTHWMPLPEPPKEETE